MKKGLLLSTTGLICLVTTASIGFAKGSGADIVSALTKNPARLGLTSGFSLAADADAFVPGMDEAWPLVTGKYWDKTTNTLKLDFNGLDIKESAPGIVDDLNKVLNSTSDLSVQAVAGMSLWRLGFGVVSTVDTDISSNCYYQNDVTDDLGFKAGIDVDGEILGRADTVAALGLPIGRYLAVGAAGKLSIFASEGISIKTTSSEIAHGIDANPNEDFRLGQGVLVDAGLVVTPFKQLQLDVAVKDLGTVSWEEQTPLWDKDGYMIADNKMPTSFTKVVGGATLKPFNALTLSGWYDKSLYGKTVVKGNVELKPLSFIALRGGYITDEKFSPGTLTLGAGLKLWALGVDAGIAVKGVELKNFSIDKVVPMGASARVSLVF